MNTDAHPEGASGEAGIHDFKWLDPNIPPILPLGYPSTIRARADVQTDPAGARVVLAVDSRVFVLAVQDAGATDPEPFAAEIGEDGAVEVSFERAGRIAEVTFVLA